ncbi:MAG: HEAT repeat domain-containing protein [Planctomycetes bacterium]|nr:HEAT repeat domain-containing protein [Planctomycetota bacterium]
MTRGRKWTTGLAGVLAVGLILSVLFPDVARRVGSAGARDTLLREIQSPDRERRKQAAWAAIERPNPGLEEYLVRGVLGDEPDAGVREAYVYALGNLGDRRVFSAIETAIDTDPSGYVRAAAWLAAARVDPEHFHTLVGTRPASRDAWDRLGVAQGRLMLGDVRGTHELLEQARGGEGSRGHIASRAMYKWLRPLLDSAGRWPADATVSEAQVWPLEFVDEIERRCATLDLQALADDTRQHDQAAAGVRRYIMRIYGAREGLISLLFGE